MTDPTTTCIDSPIGPLTILARESGVVAIRFGARNGPSATDRSGRAREVAAMAASQLDEYFAGSRRDFDVALAPDGTPFQHRVWERLRAVEYGTTCSYLEIAMEVGGANAVRAVGTANGANPIPIIVPCHRVVGADGSLVGYAGGLDRKRRLLDHEAGIATLFDTTGTA